jgi:hypothetical protein
VKKKKRPARRRHREASQAHVRELWRLLGELEYWHSFQRGELAVPEPLVASLHEHLYSRVRDWLMQELEREPAFIESEKDSLRAEAVRQARRQGGATMAEALTAASKKLASTLDKGRGQERIKKAYYAAEKRQREHLQNASKLAAAHRRVFLDA